MYFWDFSGLNILAINCGSIIMGYVRYKLSTETHDMLRNVSRRLGMKESEISRVALMDYMKSLGILSEKVKKRRVRFDLS